MAGAFITLNLRGMPELREALKRLGSALKMEVIQEALMKGAEPIRAAAAQKAPRRTGTLAEEMIAAHSTEWGRYARGAREAVAVRIGPSKKAFYGKFQELGTRRHAAQPFLRPAFDERKDEAMGIIRDELRRRVLAVGK